MLADINVIDHANLTLHKPHMIHDLRPVVVGWCRTPTAISPP